MHSLSTIKRLNERADQKFKREQKLLKNRIEKAIENVVRIDTKRHLTVDEILYELRMQNMRVK